MSEFSEHITFIKDKVIELISNNQDLKSAYNELSLQLETLQKEQDAKNEKINLLENQIENLNSEIKELKTVDTAPSTHNHNEVSEKDIDKMIKEIDECLALLDI